MAEQETEEEPSIEEILTSIRQIISDDDEEEAGGAGAGGIGGSNANRPNTASPPPNPLSTGAAVSDNRSTGVTKKALLGLGLFALLAS